MSRCFNHNYPYPQNKIFDNCPYYLLMELSLSPLSIFRGRGDSLEMSSSDHCLSKSDRCSHLRWSRFSEFKMATGGHLGNLTCRNFQTNCGKTSCYTSKLTNLDIRNSFQILFLLYVNSRCLNLRWLPVKHIEIS